MHWLPEGPRIDAFPAQMSAQRAAFLARCLTLKGEAGKPGGAFRPVGIGKVADTIQAPECILIARRDAAFGSDEFVQPLHLRTADSRLKIGHAIVESDNVVVVIRADAARRRQVAKTGEQHHVIARDCSAAACRGSLVAVEGIYGQVRAKSARHAALVNRAERGGTVDYHFQPEFTRDRDDRVHVRRNAESEHRNDARYTPTGPDVEKRIGTPFRPLAKFTRKKLRVERPGLEVDIEQPRDCTCMRDCIRGGDERQGRADDEVVAFDADGDERGMKSRRSGRRRHRALRSSGICDHLLEARHERTNRRDKCRGHAFGQVFPLVS